ncbi:MAG: hypothetical protein KIT08_09465 [Anaerolineales bacterium]|nr:MAG: hypothetical protein KIT08_09465 [Anaerolineales bacterium]
MSLRRLLSPTLVTLLAALLVLGAVLARAGWDVNELIRPGTQFTQGEPNGSEGYDGQFFYAIARYADPQEAAQYLDVPAYRYQRILLPLLARGVSFGNPSLLAWMLPLVALVAHLVGVQLLGQLLQRWSQSRWYALGYGLLLGCLLSIRLALPETLAFALVIAAVWCEERGRTPLNWLLLSLAVFAKETALLFVAAQGLSYLFARRWRDAAGLALVVGLPLAAFRLWLLGQFGSLGFGLGGANATGLEWIPFAGWWRIGEYNQVWMLVVGLLYMPTIFMPTLWGLWAGLRAWLRQQADFSALALLAHAAIFPFMTLALYIEPYGAVRLAVGLQLAALLFAGRHGVRRVLAYGVLFTLMSLWLFVPE